MLYFLSTESISGSVMSVSHNSEQFYDAYFVKIEIIALFRLSCSVQHVGFLLSLPNCIGECF